jgi:uncharacterized sulfatase
VPLIVRDPRQPGGRRCGRTAELTDLHATLADLCGIPAPATDGRSLKPLIENPVADWDRPAITQVMRGGGKKADPVMGYSVRDERYRYTEWAGGAKGVQLFDLQSDPQERQNRAADPAMGEVLARLKSRLPGK